MYRSFTLFIILLFPLAVQSQDYLWPTEASQYLTSSFGEYRSRHFHSGIDIKSWNQKGAKVFAVEDGYIWRIRTANTGYGKVLYQKLSDGNIAVYAHLDGFNDELETFVRDLHDENGAYDLDYFPRRSEFPVQKGDVIGYVGNTGTQYAHLHFEIRSPQNVPLNPLATGFTVADRVAPRPQALAVTPLSGSTKINGNHFTEMLDVNYQARLSYRSEPFTVDGPFGLEVRAYDGVSAVTNKYSIYSAELWDNDSLLFSYEYNRFSFNETILIMLERNYALERYGLGRFERLYKTPATASLPFYPENLDGQIDLPPGNHTLTIYLKDYYGNESTIQVPVQVTDPDRRVVEWEKMGSGEVVCLVTPADSSLRDNIQIDQYIPSGSLHPVDVPDYTISNDTLRLTLPSLTSPDNAYIVNLPGDSRADALEQYPYSENEVITREPEFEWVYSELGMIATLEFDEPLYKPVKLEIISADLDTAIAFQTSNLRFWNTAPISSPLLRNSAILVSADSEILTFFPYDNTIALPNTRSSLASPQHEMELQFAGNSLFHSALVWYDKDSEIEEDNLSPVWDFNPKTIPLRNPALLRMQVPDTSFPKRQIGIYWRRSERSNWRYLPSEFSADSTLLSGEIASLETFTLRRDSIPPVIRVNTPGPGRSYSASSLDNFVFTIYDRESTVPSRDGIQLFLDDQEVVIEYNPITNVMMHRLRTDLSSGTHTMKVLATDAAGNKTERSYEFTVR